MDKKTIWLVDDDSATLTYLSELLTVRGFGTQCMNSGEHLLRRLAAPNCVLPSLLLLDIRLPRIGGLEVLTELEKRGQRIPSIVLSGVDDVSTAVHAIQLGASDYLVKPLNEEALYAAMGRILESGLEHVSSSGGGYGSFVLKNARMLQVRSLCDQVARTDVPVLILGESGVGKEVFARYLHSQSGRGSQFVRVNCAALPADLLESELFGHERGAFTGAHQDKPGKFEQAGSGTIFLDEIAEMSPTLQAKLLHVLQDGEYARLGGTESHRSQARILAATNKKLEELVANGGFREDLYFRLNVIVLEIPPLRERPDDIETLCSFFVGMYREKYKSPVTELPPLLVEAFRRYHWPGNVRQLENHIRRFLILPDLHRALRELEHTPAARTESVSAPQVQAGPVSLKELSATAAEVAEKEMILKILNEVNWNRKQAAQRLDICYKSLLNKLHRWELGSQQPASRVTRKSASEPSNIESTSQSAC